jgi:hypothetical protein
VNSKNGSPLGARFVATLLGLAALYPVASRQWAAHQSERALARYQRAPAGRASTALPPALSLRVQRLKGLLASWETIGGCGAGTSTGAGGGIKWIGRGTAGGLFQLQTLGTYTHLRDGYILSLSNQVSRDLSEKWNAGFSVPLLYKYYRNYYNLNPPVDISNGGLGDVSAFLTRRFGEINNTALTLSVGFPTATHDARYKNDLLTQEKQLGIGKVTGTLVLDHTLDELWGIVVLGGSVGYRGGQNELGNYRAPVANVYGYAGYFMGPWVPSLGLTVQRFFGVDRDRTLDQQEQLTSVAATAEIEWSTDWLAILAGVSLPYGFEIGGAPAEGTANPLRAGFQPWTAAVGVSLSPF